MKLVIGLESHVLPREELEEVQLVTADGEHFALIQQYPVWENALLVIAAFDAREILKEFVADVKAAGLNNTQEEWPDLMVTWDKAQRLLADEVVPDCASEGETR
jgi:hypothetical protein